MELKDQYVKMQLGDLTLGVEHKIFMGDKHVRKLIQIDKERYEYRFSIVGEPGGKEHTLCSGSDVSYLQVYVRANITLSTSVDEHNDNTGDAWDVSIKDECSSVAYSFKAPFNVFTEFLPFQRK